MDYRKRQYYLIDIRNDELNYKFYMMKQIAPSVKLSSPYKHFKSKEALIEGIFDYITSQLELLLDKGALAPLRKHRIEQYHRRPL